MCASERDVIPVHFDQTDRRAEVEALRVPGMRRYAVHDVTERTLRAHTNLKIQNAECKYVSHCWPMAPSAVTISGVARILVWGGANVSTALYDLVI